MVVRPAPTRVSRGLPNLQESLLVVNSEQTYNSETAPYQMPPCTMGVFEVKTSKRHAVVLLLIQLITSSGLLTFSPRRPGCMHDSF